MTIITKQGKCKWCDYPTGGYERDEENQKWITYNPDMSVHEIDECRANQAAKKKNYQAKAQQQQVQKTQTQKYFQTKNETNTATGININSVYFVMTKQFAEIKQKLDELRANTVTKKEMGEQAAIIDSVAQNVDILVKKVGYPEPKRVTQEQVTEKAKEIDKGFDQAFKEIKEEKENVNTSFQDIVRPKQFNLKDVSKDDWKEPSVVECNKCGAKVDRKIAWVTGRDKGNVLLCENCFHEPKQEEQQALSPSGWTLISEKSICHSCQNVFHNGYMRWGTKLCEKCKTDIEANEEFKKIQEGENDEGNPSINQLNEEVDDNKNLIEDDI